MRLLLYYVVRRTRVRFSKHVTYLAQTKILEVVMKIDGVGHLDLSKWIVDA